MARNLQSLAGEAILIRVSQMATEKKRPLAKDLFPREFEIVVHALDEDQGVGGGYLRGEVSIDGETLPFSGVAFGRFGGHNINIEFEQSGQELERLLGLGEEDIENFKVAVQVRIVQGEMKLENKESHKHEHVGPDGTKSASK